MKRIVLAATASALLLAPAAGAADRAPDPVAKQRQQREILVRGVVLAVSPVKVRASIGSIVTCQVHNRTLVANLEVGDHVLMKCVARDGRWILRRLAIHPIPPRPESSRERDVRALPAAPIAPVVRITRTRDGVKDPGS
jgi:hypothetical protein